MNNIRSIEIHWTYPKLLKDLQNNPFGSCRGIYQVTRKINGVEYIVYIGKTHQDFITRFKNHFKIHKLPQRSPNYYIRLGVLDAATPKTPLSEEEYKDFLMDVESAIIWETINVTHARYPERLCYFINRQQCNDYTYRCPYYIKILNTGKYGKIAKEINSKTHDDAYLGRN